MDQIPVTRPVAPISDQQPDTRRFARRLARRRSDLAADADTEDELAPSESPRLSPLDPAQPLLEALDRLRVTQEIRPVDQEYAAAVRKLRAQQDPTTGYHRRPSSA